MHIYYVDSTVLYICIENVQNDIQGFFHVMVMTSFAGHCIYCVKYSISCIPVSFPAWRVPSENICIQIDLSMFCRIVLVVELLHSGKEIMLLILELW